MTETKSLKTEIKKFAQKCREKYSRNRGCELDCVEDEFEQGAALYRGYANAFLIVAEGLEKILKDFCKKKSADPGRHKFPEKE